MRSLMIFLHKGQDITVARYTRCTHEHVENTFYIATRDEVEYAKRQ